MRVARSLGWKEGQTQRKTRPPQAGLGVLPQKQDVTVTSSEEVVKVMAAFWYPPKKGGTAMPGSKKGAIDLTAPYQSQNKPTNKPKASPHDLSWPETHPKLTPSISTVTLSARQVMLERPTDRPTHPATNRSKLWTGTSLGRLPSGRVPRTKPTFSSTG